MEFKYTNEKLYVLENEVELGFIWYQLVNNEITVIQTYVNEIARGKGIAKILNDEFFTHFDAIGAYNLKIYCSYTKSLFEKNGSKFKNFTLIED